MEEQKAISSIITPHNLTHNIHTDDKCKSIKNYIVDNIFCTRHKNKNFLSSQLI